jgi:hypothetical protein
MDKLTGEEVEEIIEFSERFPAVFYETVIKNIYVENCKAGNANIVKIFLERKIIKNACHYCEGFNTTITNKRTDIVKMFLDDKDRNPFHNCQFCYSPIFVCVFNNNSEILKLLLDDGRESQTNLGITFNWCVQYGSAQCAKLLIDKIDNNNSLNCDFVTKKAANRGDLEMIKFLAEDRRFIFNNHLIKFIKKRQIEIIRVVLLNKSYNKNIINKCLNKACYLRFDDIVKLLSEKIDINDVTNDKTKKYLREHINHAELIETTKKFKNILDSMNDLYGEITALQ